MIPGNRCLPVASILDLPSSGMSLLVIAAIFPAFMPMLPRINRPARKHELST